MLIFALLKCCIEDFDVWPSNILHSLICDKPYTKGVRDFCAFCYGNGLPLRFAKTFFVLCNDQCNHISSYTIYTFYNLWHTDTSTNHHAHYNVKHKKYIWINGSDHHWLHSRFVLFKRSNGFGSVFTNIWIVEFTRPNSRHKSVCFLFSVFCFSYQSNFFFDAQNFFFVRD
jgi:hypothetical protein